MSYEEIPITEELNESVQRAVRIAPRRHETLGKLVKDIAAQRGVRRKTSSRRSRPATRSEPAARSSIPTASLTP